MVKIFLQIMKVFIKDRQRMHMQNFEQSGIKTITFKETKCRENDLILCK